MNQYRNALIIDPLQEPNLVALYGHIYMYSKAMRSYIYATGGRRSQEIVVNELNTVMHDLEQYILSGKRGPWIPKYLPSAVVTITIALRRAEVGPTSEEILLLFDKNRPRALYTLMYLTERAVLDSYIKDNGIPVTLNKPRNSGDSDATSIT